MPESGHGSDGRLAILVVKRHDSPFQHRRNLLTLELQYKGFTGSLTVYAKQAKSVTCYTIELIPD
jgi:hypothetical protein